MAVILNSQRDSQSLFRAITEQLAKVTPWERAGVTFFGYLSSIFRPVMHLYALLFVAESGTLYIYDYGWDKMTEGFLKWIHVSMLVVLNVIGTVPCSWPIPGSHS